MFMQLFTLFTILLTYTTYLFYLHYLQYNMPTYSTNNTNTYTTYNVYKIIRACSFGIFRNKNISGIYSRIYSGYSAPGSRIPGMEIQVFRIKNSSQTNAYLHYSNYSYSGLTLNKRALRLLTRLTNLAL